MNETTNIKKEGKVVLDLECNEENIIECPVCGNMQSFAIDFSGFDNEKGTSNLAKCPKCKTYTILKISEVKIIAIPKL